MAKARSPKEKILEVAVLDEEKPKRRTTRGKTADRDDTEKPARRRTAARREEDTEPVAAEEAPAETPRPVLTPLPSHPVRDDEYQEVRAHAVLEEEPAAQ
ncbi:MAG: transcription termination factor Rho, partial [Archangium sp.]